MVSAGAQVGVLAACVVLFVPMGLAGWHLSRNKVLFFSGALFVSLAVGVHLSPYLPSLPHLLVSSFHPLHPVAPSSSSASCISFLHRVSWADAEAANGGGGAGGRAWSWPPSLAATCGFARLTRDDASTLLNGSWVMVAGDSQARLLVLALLRLLLDPVAVAAAEPELFRRHSDYHAAVPARGIAVDFIWAPFESNLTRLLHEDLRLAPRIPDVLVLGSGLWHMLHVTDASQYSDAWTSVADAANSLRSPLPVPPPHLFGHGLPRLVNPMFNADAKKAHMDDAKYFPRTRIPKPRTRKVDLRLGPARSPSRPRVPRCLRHRALRMPSWTRGKIPGRQDRHMENPKNPKTDPAERQDLQSDPRTPRPRCDKYFCPDATRSTSRNTAHFAAECQVLHFERHDRLRRPEDHECDKIGTDPEESDAPRRHAKFVYPDAKIYIPDPKTLNPGVRSRSRRTLNPEADPEPRNPKIVEP